MTRTGAPELIKPLTTKAYFPANKINCMQKGKEKSERKIPTSHHIFSNGLAE